MQRFDDSLKKVDYSFQIVHDCKLIILYIEYPLIVKDIFIDRERFM